MTLFPYTTLFRSTENHSNVLHVMKDDDYKAMLNETAKDYALDLNNDALIKYKPENLKK